MGSFTWPPSQVSRALIGEGGRPNVRVAESTTDCRCNGEYDEVTFGCGDSAFPVGSTDRSNTPSGDRRAWSEGNAILVPRGGSEPLENCLRLRWALESQAIDAGTENEKVQTDASTVTPRAATAVAQLPVIIQ